MHEVKQPGAWLPEALRELAAESERDAPPRVGAALKETFPRSRCARRRLAGLAAALLLAAGITLWLRAPRPGAAAVSRQLTSMPAAQTLLGTALAVHAPPDQARTASRPATNVQRPAAESRFTALPAYDAHLTDEDLRVVRLQLSGDALRRVGVPVREENSERVVLADFVVGQDGTPYAFRLVAP